MNIVKRFFLWTEYRNHPCYIGYGEFDHDLECQDDSFDHEYGVEQILYMQCQGCGVTREEDKSIPTVSDYYGDEHY